MLNLSTEEHALNLFEKGLSKRAISRQLGVSHTLINKWLDSHASNNSRFWKPKAQGVETPEKTRITRDILTGRKDPLLDLVTNNSATPTKTVLREDERQISLETGEILPISSYNPLIKWELLHAAKSILGTSHRIFRCCAAIRPDFLKAHKDIEIRGDMGRKPYYVGPMVCGRVWICPVCALKIQAYRALEIRACIDAWLERGGSVWMVTQTIPHTRFDVLEDMLTRFSKAFYAFKSSRKWRDIQDSYELFGYIKALEVTWGAEYGWHPHLHTIFFTNVKKSVFDVSAFKAELFQQWSACTAKHGFSDLSPNAFTVQDASKIKEYLNKLTGEVYKWGSEHEITKLHSKKARGKSLVPFDFLRIYNEDPQTLYAALFREFATAFHGKMHLVHSKGLKKDLLGTQDKTDEEIAQSLGELDAVLATITPFQWSSLLRLREKAWRGELLKIVEDFGQVGLRHYLESKDIWVSPF